MTEIHYLQLCKNWKLKNSMYDVTLLPYIQLQKMVLHLLGSEFATIKVAKFAFVLRFSKDAAENVDSKQ